MSTKRRIAPALPGSVSAFDKQRKTFTCWLLEHGSAIKQPTNPYEVIRFQGQNTDCIVYRKANDTISHWTGGAAEAYRAFLDNTPWRACERGQRDRKTVNTILSIVARDGWGCAYCLAELTVDTATIEHWVPVTAGGNSHMANLTLACRPCNDEAGHLSAREKAEIVVRKRIAVYA